MKMQEEELRKRQELLLTAMGITMQKMIDMLSPVDTREEELLREHDKIRDGKIYKIRRG